MAFTVTARHSGTSGTSAVQTLATGSTTPTANSLLVAFGGVQSNSHATAHSWQLPTGGGWTYTSILASDQFDWETSPDFDVSCSLWRAAVGGSPGAHTVTVDAWSGTQTGTYGALCCDVTGHNASSPVLQSKKGGASINPNSSSASGALTFDSALTTGSLVIVGYASGNDAAGTYTAPTIGGQAMTELHNQSGTFTHCGMWYRVITGAESNATITCSDLGQSIGNWAATAVEIAADSGATNLVIQDALQATLAEQFGVTQDHILVIQDARHTTSADVLDLTQVHQIAIHDALHASVAENVVLASGISLVVQKATHLTSADGLVLVQSHNLAVQDALQSTTADNISLVPPGTGGFMTVSDAQMQKLQTLTGLTGSIADLERAYYGGLSGLSPIQQFSVQDHKRAYWEAQTGLTGRSLADLEKAFYDVQLVAAGSLSDREYTYWVNL